MMTSALSIFLLWGLCFPQTAARPGKHEIGPVPPAHSAPALGAWRTCAPHRASGKPRPAQAPVMPPSGATAPTRIP